MGSWPPACLKTKQETECKVVEVLHLLRCFTHTHLYRKAFRIVDLECIMRANQQQERETRQKGGSEYSLAF